jgi:alpha-D-xyloside xylohydrolase
MKRCLLLCLSIFPSVLLAASYKEYSVQEDRISVVTTDGNLDLIPVTENAVRVQFNKDIQSESRELVLTEPYSMPKFDVIDSVENLTLKTKGVAVTLDKNSGSLSFKDSSGNTFLCESVGSRKLLESSVNGETCYVAEQSFNSPRNEHLFGLGQFQDGQYNLRGFTRRLTQVNTQIAIPFIYSSKGYGILWHQYGLTDFNPADNDIELIRQGQGADDNSQMAEVTTTSGTQRVSQSQSLYVGEFTAPKDGVYSIFLDLGNMGNRQYVVIDGKACIDQTNIWLPPTSSRLVNLKAGKHSVQLVCKSNNTPKLSWKLKDDQTTFRSPNAKGLDYVVFYGPSADQVIAQYRDLSGKAPMLPKWAYGFWQCRERYMSAEHLTSTVKEFRKQKLPMDVIVQDWQYWGNNGWGVPQFDETNYPNPAKFIRQLHDDNAHFVVSVWSNPDKNSTIGREYVQKERYIPNTKWLDYFNPETRKEYWETLKENLFDNGVDAWWMDATEPENDALVGQHTFWGLGDFYRLVYPSLVCKSVYEGQRKSSDKRVCILTRSAFSGQQRYGSINWSGDIGGTWDSYRRQIVAGLNYSMTGLPYWTTDIGGFFRLGNAQYTDENYRELLVRWFQWGVFNPIFRSHGYMTETEPWKYGQKTEDDIRETLNLRSQLLSYIYSEAWKITKNGSTMMRPLVMDFQEDPVALEQPYEYMFGEAILVAPVTEFGIRESNVYLPQSTDWYDFWTKERYSGGQKVTVETPLNRIPLFVKAGSIIPMGPVRQHSTENSNAPVEFCVYTGANGSFTLYEDEGTNYDYEKGAYTEIPLTWDEENQSLTIGTRQGSFEGMQAKREFRITFVQKEKGQMPTHMVPYSGKQIKIPLN